MKTITLKKSDSKFSALPGGLEERIKGTLGDLVRNHPYSTLADESGKFALVLGEFKLIFYTMSGKLVSIDIGATDMEAKPPVIPPAPAAQSIKIEPYQKIKHKMGSKDDFLFHTENMLRGK